MRHFAIILLALAVVSCTSKWQPGDQIKDGYDYLRNAGICDDSLNVANDVNFDNDGANLPHRILDMATCQSLGLDKMMGVDSAFSIVRVWGIKKIQEKGITLMLGETSYSDMRTCWLATYGKDGIIDFMRLGECGGMNLSYWDDIDEHTRHIGIDSMRLVMPDKSDKPMHLSRWISLKEQCDDLTSDSTIWFIHHELPITIGNDGHFSIGKVGIVYSSDTTLLTPYWRNKRQLEVFAWTPMSDSTLYDRVEDFLEQAQGTITEPAQLLGDFNMLMFGRMYSDTENFMRWCCDHPESQLSRATVNVLKDANPDYLRADLKKIQDSTVRERARQILGL